MLKEYVKIAFRRMSRNSLVTFINLFGLALSMSICLLVLMRIKDRLSYDQFHRQPDRIYRIISQLTDQEGRSYLFATTPMPMAAAIAKDYNITESIVRLYTPGTRTASLGKKSLPLTTAFSDSTFFDVFGFSLSQGDPKTALSQPNSLVLNTAAAIKFFGSTDIIGKSLSIDNYGEFRITGVLKDGIGKSHIDYEAFVSASSMPALIKSAALPAAADQWNAVAGGYTYLRVKEKVTRSQLSQAIQAIAAGLRKKSPLVGKENIAFEAQPFKSINLGEELQNNMGDTGSRGKTLAEAVIAFIILLMACFNYTNLSIASSLNRGKEIGVRKVAGAMRIQVFVQFVVESLLMSLMALVLAFVILKWIVDYAPFASELVPKGAGATIGFSTWSWFLLFAVFTGVFAGFLPSWTLSSFKPVDVLKNLSTVKLFGGNIFRRSLTVAQFTLSLFIIIFTSIFSSQFHYIATADPGFRRDSLLNIPLYGADPAMLANGMSGISGVSRISACSDPLGRFSNNRCSVKTNPGADAASFDYTDIDSGFLANAGLHLLAGRTFPGKSTNRTEQYVLVNEMALPALNARTPFDAIGKAIWIDDSIQVHVIGVIRNFYTRGLDMSLTPLVLRNRTDKLKWLNIEMANAPNTATKAQMATVWRKLEPSIPFESHWLRDDLYARESAHGTVSILGFLAFIAITISCLGLLGMVIYATETRRKEIGIRKVMGASVSAIVMLLSKGFLKLIFLAGAIALPLSYLAGYFFLTIFANRITIGIDILAGGFLGLLALALLTIGARIFKVAAANPVDSLRVE